MKKIKPWLLLLLVFVAGAVMGVFVTRLAMRHFVIRAIAHPELVREKIEREMVRKLGLQAEQQTKVHQILLDAHGQIKTLRREFQPRFLEIFDKAQADIAATLTPEQQRKFEKLRAEHQHLWLPKEQLK